MSSAGNETVITPHPSVSFADLVEVWRYRALLRSMVVRHVKAEFSDLRLGIFWVCARPLLMLVIFVLFRKLTNSNMGVTIPYDGYLYSGLVLWFFFVESVTSAATSIKRDAGLIRKVYFPRLLSPLSTLLANLFGLGVAMVPLVFIMAWHGIVPGPAVMLIPLILLQVMSLAFGIGCIFAALGVESGDSDRFLSLVLYVAIFVSPVIYGPGLLEGYGKWAVILNPMAPPLLAFRAALFPGMEVPWETWALSAALTLGIALVGFLLFKRLERAILDSL